MLRRWRELSGLGVGGITWWWWYWEEWKKKRGGYNLRENSLVKKNVWPWREEMTRSESHLYTKESSLNQRVSSIQKAIFSIQTLHVFLTSFVHSNKLTWGKLQTKTSFWDRDKILPYSNLRFELYGCVESFKGQFPMSWSNFPEPHLLGPRGSNSEAQGFSFARLQSQVGAESAMGPGQWFLMAGIPSVHCEDPVFSQPRQSSPEIWYLV